MFDTNALIGSQFDGKFKILSLLGAGGMGVVYKAEQSDLGRLVAIKVLQFDKLDDEESSLRFSREAKTLSLLSHPNIGAFFSYGIWQNSFPYIVLEYIEGKSLNELLEAEDKLPWQRALNIAVQVCRALAHSHEMGVIHRDVKPGNIILLNPEKGQQADVQEDMVKLVDFGLSKLIDKKEELQKLTQTGALVGTVQYMSPELCLGKKPDQRSDIYSLACVLYRSLTGFTPHDADNPIGLLHKHVNETPILPSVKSGIKLPDGLEQVLMKALSRDPENRYQTMLEFESDLNLILGRRAQETLALKAETGAKPVRKVAVLLLLVVLLASFLFAGIYLNTSLWQQLMLEMQVSAAPSEKNLRAALEIYKRLAGQNLASDKLEKARSRLFDYARSVSPLAASGLCREFACSLESDSESAEWARRGLSLLLSANIESTNYLQFESLASEFAAICVKSKKRLTIDPVSTQSLIDKLRAYDRKHKVASLLKLKLKAIENTKDYSAILTCYLGLGEIYAARGELESSQESFGKARKIALKMISPETHLFEICMREANSLRTLDRLKARGIFDQGLSLYRKNPEQQAPNMIILVDASLHFSEFKLAKELAKKALALLESESRSLDSRFNNSKFISSSLRDGAGARIGKSQDSLFEHASELLALLMRANLLSNDVAGEKELLQNALAGQGVFWEGTRSSSQFSSFAALSLEEADLSCSELKRLNEFALRRAAELRQLRFLKQASQLELASRIWTRRMRARAKSNRE